MTAQKLSRILAVAGALALAACDKAPPPEVVLVTAPAPEPVIPDECDPARDPAWQDLPDRDVRLSEGARNHAANKHAMARLKGLRRVCFAGLAANRRARQ